jgi:hypothetical protein
MAILVGSKSLREVFFSTDVMKDKAEPMEKRMMRYDPVTELEITERSFAAMIREAEELPDELHKRIIEARRAARVSALDRLLGRIDSLLDAA